MVDILRNAAKCLLCKQTIESKHRHDFVTCKCGNLSVDGGLDYLKRSVRDIGFCPDGSSTEDKSRFAYSTKKSKK